MGEKESSKTVIIAKMTNTKLLEDLMTWTRIYRTEETLKGDERKHFKALVAEVRKRGLIRRHIS